MKTKTLLFIFFMTSILCHAQFDSFSTTIHDPDQGDLDVVLYKYNTRGDNFQVFTYDGTTLTPYTTLPGVRSYRGYISNMENSKIAAVWYPDNTLYIKTFNGKGEKNGFEVKNVDISQLTITKLNLPIVNSPQKAERRLTSGFTTDHGWMIKNDSRTIDHAIAVFEFAVCQYDISIARDIGASMELNTLVFPTSEIVTRKNLFRPLESNNPDLNVTKVFWNCWGSGGGAGRKQYCKTDYNTGRTSVSEKGFGSLPHELGHTLDLGHYHNQQDAMHSNMFFLGRENSNRAIKHLKKDGDCLAVSTPNYTDPVHPYTPEDYAITSYNTPITIDVLENDIDYNHDVITIKDFDDTSLSGGSITQVGQKLEYTPQQNFIGRDYFYYRAQSGNVNDGTYYWNKAKVFVDVRGENDLALHYSFEESEGTIINDSGWGLVQHQGTSKASIETSSVDGIDGSKGIQFGVDKGVYLNDVLDPLNKSLSISLWFNLDEVPSSSKDKKMLFDSGNRGTLNNAGISMLIDADKIQFLAQQEDVDKTGSDRFKTVNWETGVWYHAVMVIDFEQHKLFGYLDGVELGSSEYTQDIPQDAVFKGYPGGINTRVSTAIGMRATSKPEMNLLVFMGKMDDFKIYTKALSSTEVLSTDDNLTSNNAINVLYPNPFGDYFTIKLKKSYTSASIEVLNVLGQSVYLKLFKNMETIKIPSKTLPSGSYVIKVDIDGNTTSKVVIKK